MKNQNKPLHANHRQRLREKYVRDEASMCDHEMLELFLFDIIPRRNTNPIAHELINKFGSLLGVFTASKKDLMTVNGIGERAATYIIDAYETTRAELNEKLERLNCNNEKMKST